MNETIIEGRFKKLLGISTFGNGDSKKRHRHSENDKKKTGLHNAMGPFYKNDHHDMVLLCAKFF